MCVVPPVATDVVSSVKNMLEWVLVVHALINSEPITAEFNNLRGWTCKFAASRIRSYLEHENSKIVIDKDVVTNITVHCEERERL